MVSVSAAIVDKTVIGTPGFVVSMATEFKREMAVSKATMADATFEGAIKAGERVGGWGRMGPRDA